MVEINVCPATLQEGFTTYSPAARKLLFDGKGVFHVLDFDSPNNDSADNEAYLKNVGRISLSGVQPKASLVLNAEGQLVKPEENEPGTFILKPAPTSYALLDRKYCPANEHLTMQLASQVYHIEIPSASSRTEKQPIFAVGSMSGQMDRSIVRKILPRWQDLPMPTAAAITSTAI